MLPIKANARLGHKVNFAGSKRPRKCIYSLPAQETAKHRAMFGWPPVSDVAAVTKERHETRWNLLGCHKLPNRSELLVGQSSPYCGDIWRRYCCLTSFFPIVDTGLSCENIAKLFDGAQMAIFGDFGVFFGSCISSEPHAAHFRPAF